MPPVVLSLGATLLVMVAALGVAGAQGGLSIKVLESSNAFPSPEALVEVRDGDGRPVADLRPDQFAIIQDGQPAAPGNVSVSDQTTESRGPALAVVLDASKLLGAEQVEAARKAAVGLLQAGGAISSTDPEVVSLFVPSGAAPEASRIDEFADFTHDHNAVINYLNTRLELQPNTTPLYGVLSDAIDAAADAAKRRGTPAYVAVFSDGQDPISGDSFEAALARARQRNVAVLAASFGPLKGPKTGSQRLRRLATETRGVYLERPQPDDVGKEYTSLVKLTPQSVYSVRYTSNLPPDDQVHIWQVLVNVDGAEARSQQIPFQATLPAKQPHPLNTIMNAYLLRAVPAAVVLSALLTLLLALWQRSGREDSRRLRGGLGNAPTLKRPSGRL
jgi:hypothetical protein